MIRDEWDQADNDRQAERERLASDKKKASAKLVAPYYELLLSCPECGQYDKKNMTTVDVIVGHMIEWHNYSVEQTQRWIKDWIDEFDHAEDGWPLGECEGHGFYRLPGPCSGCEAEESKND